jgi:hypothetical protein
VRRRNFIKVVVGSAVTWPFVVNAQQSVGKVFRVGFVGSLSADSLPERVEAFRAGLRDLGYQERAEYHHRVPLGGRTL